MLVHGAAVEEQTSVGWREKGRAGWPLTHFVDAGGSDIHLAAHWSSIPATQQRLHVRVGPCGLQRVALPPRPDTVRHLITAIRKLCAINECKQILRGDEYCYEKLVYRGVSGKLLDSFFEPAVQGMITAVDTGFMSTSAPRNTPVEYTNGGPGALFVLCCTRQESSPAFSVPRGK
jgi:hypothetical protein